MLGANPANAATSLLYTGEMYDSYLQHYYLRARWYDQQTGRFNRTDPFAGNNQDPQSLHKYLYAHCNPINALDPSGNFSLGEVLTVRVITAIAIASIGPAVLAAYDTAKAGGSWMEIIGNASYAWAVSFEIGIGAALLMPILIPLIGTVAGFFGISAGVATAAVLVLLVALSLRGMIDLWRSDYPISIKIIFTATVVAAFLVSLGRDGIKQIASSSKAFIKHLFSKGGADPVDTRSIHQVTLNKMQGDAWRDEFGSLMEKGGYDVRYEVPKDTPFGLRKIDIEVWKDGRCLGGIETKSGSSAYLPAQRAKDAYLWRAEHYAVTVARDK